MALAHPAGTFVSSGARERTRLEIVGRRGRHRRPKAHARARPRPLRRGVDKVEHVGSDPLRGAKLGREIAPLRRWARAVVGGVKTAAAPGGEASFSGKRAARAAL